jgi:small-conductance mechanosensitive channel
MMKSKVVNLTRFPIRRLDLEIPIAYAEDLERVRDLLLQTAERNEHSLSEPPPLFFITGYDDSCVRAQFSVWAENANWLAFLETITREIKEAFDHHEIRFPYPHRVVLGQPLA